MQADETETRGNDPWVVTEQMRAELQHVLTAAKELPTEQLPHLLGELEEIRCTALARLSAPAPAQIQEPLLDVEAAAHKRGEPRLSLSASRGTAVHPSHGQGTALFHLGNGKMASHSKMT